MNVLRLISQLIGIETLRLTKTHTQPSIDQEKKKNQQFPNKKNQTKNKKFESLTTSKLVATTDESASRDWETPVQEPKMANQE